MSIDPDADLNNNKIRYIPFYFGGDKDLFTFLDKNDTAEISLGNGIKNLITFYNLAKNNLMAEKLNETGTSVGEIKTALNSVTDTVSLKNILQISHEMAADAAAANIFSPYKVQIKTGTAEFKPLTKEHIKVDEIGDEAAGKTFKNIIKIIPDVAFGGKTRKGGRKHKRKQRKSAKRKSSRKRKTM